MYLNHTSPFNEKPQRPSRSRKKKGDAKTVVHTERPEELNFLLDATGNLREVWIKGDKYHRAGYVFVGDVKSDWFFFHAEKRLSKSGAFPEALTAVRAEIQRRINAGKWSITEPRPAA
jgi:hypothetical protein